MVDDIKHLGIRLEAKRSELNRLGEKLPLCSDELLQKSKELDELHNQWLNAQKLKADCGNNRPNSKA